uniref:Uncharacterized protein n=1 Tax=Anguilla anguilla TaxID=7936 RepID=A0A0E9W7U4_ANGAN
MKINQKQKGKERRRFCFNSNGQKDGRQHLILFLCYCVRFKRNLYTKKMFLFVYIFTVAKKGVYL